MNDRRLDEESCKRVRFNSVIVPPWWRFSPKLTEVLPRLCVHGLSTGDSPLAFEGFYGSAAGLSSSVIARLTAAWHGEHRAFLGRDLSERDYV